MVFSLSDGKRFDAAVEIIKQSKNHAENISLLADLGLTLDPRMDSDERKKITEDIVAKAKSLITATEKIKTKRVSRAKKAIARGSDRTVSRAS